MTDQKRKPKPRYGGEFGRAFAEGVEGSRPLAPAGGGFSAAGDLDPRLMEILERWFPSDARNPGRMSMPGEAMGPGEMLPRSQWAPGAEVLDQARVVPQEMDRPFGEALAEPSPSQLEVSKVASPRAAERIAARASSAAPMEISPSQLVGDLSAPKSGLLPEALSAPNPMISDLVPQGQQMELGLKSPMPSTTTGPQLGFELRGQASPSTSIPKPTIDPMPVPKPTIRAGAAGLAGMIGPALGAAALDRFAGPKINEWLQEGNPDYKPYQEPPWFSAESPALLGRLAHKAFGNDERVSPSGQPLQSASSLPLSSSPTHQQPPSSLDAPRPSTADTIIAQAIAKARGLTGEQSKLPDSMQSAPAEGPYDLERLLGAFVKGESGGDPSIQNARTDASGLTQIMPRNITGWTDREGTYHPSWLEEMGKPRGTTVEQFLQNPELQKEVSRFKMKQMMDRELGAGRSPDEAIQRTAAEWYSGKPDRWNDPTPLGHPGEPDVQTYAQGVLGRYKDPNFKAPDASARFQRKLPAALAYEKKNKAGIIEADPSKRPPALETAPQRDIGPALAEPIIQRAEYDPSKVDPFMREQFKKRGY